ncbi:hypothetical protein F5887DRAFT_1073042 [Amanita rubescens]|nr:hypothetical protein F5887DRAFT_1073042 [Amanita rubescens]
MSARHKQRPRAVSPARSVRPNASLSPTARVSTRSHTSTSQPSTPESSRLRSLTNSGGASLNHALSFSSLKAESASAPPVRITSKVSGVAKTIHANDHVPTPTHRNRTPSGSSVATSPPPTFYPITTATPAANPYRYAPSRPIINRLGSPFGTLRVDPSTPPLSPPISSISISSQSSAASHATKDGCSSPDISPAALARTSSVNGHHRSSSESQDNDWGEDDDDDNEERKVKAAAKSNRKIEDLEITNRSLMAINASLEKTKNKQAKEIRELRRKLRESRLILPPHTFRAVESSLDHDDDDDDDGEEDDDVEETEETDDVFLRVKVIVENLLESGRRALETKVADFGGVGVAKVLSAEEARSWRRNSLVDDDLEQPPSPSRIAVPDSDDDDTPLDDEDMISSSSPPNIHHAFPMIVAFFLHVLQF